MKNTIKILGIIALVAVIGFSMIACDDGNGGGGGGVNFSVENSSNDAITNIKVFAVTDGIPMEKTGNAKYDSGTISVAKDAKHDFKVSGISDGYTAAFWIEATAGGKTTTSALGASANSTIVVVYGVVGGVEYLGLK